ncbi:MAG: hypothetical protein AAGF26_11240, partial [Cyanobacteria bacterium P01_G01_bin.49]
LLIISCFLITLPANAAICRQINEHTVCILKIKRSAKNYWEYRVSVKIDDQVRPTEIYNCRNKRRITQNGKIIPFESDGIGNYICRVLG